MNINSELEKLNTKYNEEKERMHKAYLDISFLANAVVRYSEFEVSSIVDTLSALINVFESIKVVSLSKDIHNGLMREHVAIITLEDYEHLFEYSAFASNVECMKNSKFPVIYFYPNAIDEVKFYSLDEESTSAIYNYPLNGNPICSYDYIKDFIDYVIGYRIDKDKEDINAVELNNLLKQFLKENLQKLKDFYKKQAEQSKQRLEKYRNSTKRKLELLQK